MDFKNVMEIINSGMESYDFEMSNKLDAECPDYVKVCAELKELYDKLPKRQMLDIEARVVRAETLVKDFYYSQGFSDGIRFLHKVLAGGAA